VKSSVAKGLARPDSIKQLVFTDLDSRQKQLQTEFDMKTIKEEFVGDLKSNRKAS
jgi:hypothetical protein